MTLRPPILTLFALSTFGCVITPGLLEGGADEAGSTDSGATDSGSTDASSTDASSTDSTDTTDTGLALDECQQGTNPAGGSDPGEFPISTCMVCDQGWGHDAPQLPIEWTIELSPLGSQTSYAPLALAPRSGGDGVVVISQRDADVELLNVSASGETLDANLLQTSLAIGDVEVGDSVIFFAALDLDTTAWSVLAATQTGEVLWATPMTSAIQDLAATPEGGVVVAQIAGPMVGLDAEGSILWTNPEVMAQPIGVGVSAKGSIVVGGSEADLLAASLEFYTSDGTSLLQVEVPGSAAQLVELIFLDTRRIFAGGTNFGEADTEDLVALLVDLDQPELGWTHSSNRTSSSCYFEGTPYEQASREWFMAAEALADGSVLIAATEEGPRQEGNAMGGQARVLHVDAQGNLLAADRGLWYGQARALARGEAGSAYAALLKGGYLDGDQPNTGFYLRKYQP